VTSKSRSKLGLQAIAAAANVADLQRVALERATQIGAHHVVAGRFKLDDAGDLTIVPLVDTAPIQFSIPNLLVRPDFLPMLLELLLPGRPYDAESAPAFQHRKEYEALWPLYSAATKCKTFIMIPVRESGILRGFSAFLFESDAPSNATEMLQALCDAVFARMLELALINPLASPLTRRQSDALRICSEGKSDAEIGEALGISAATAHEHIQEAKRRLGVRTRIEAVVIAVRKGWI
jgi:DNA-binding CsgD family transcriptional regulator